MRGNRGLIAARRVPTCGDFLSKKSVGLSYSDQRWACTAKYRVRQAQHCLAFSCRWQAGKEWQIAQLRLSELLLQRRRRSRPNGGSISLSTTAELWPLASPPTSTNLAE